MAQISLSTEGIPPREVKSTNVGYKYEELDPITTIFTIALSLPYPKNVKTGAGKFAVQNNSLYVRTDNNNVSIPTFGLFGYDYFTIPLPISIAANTRSTVNNTIGSTSESKECGRDWVTSVYFSAKWMRDWFPKEKEKGENIFNIFYQHVIAAINPLKDTCYSNLPREKMFLTIPIRIMKQGISNTLEPQEEFAIETNERECLIRMAKKFWYENPKLILQLVISTNKILSDLKENIKIIAHPQNKHETKIKDDLLTRYSELHQYVDSINTHILQTYRNTNDGLKPPENPILPFEKLNEESGYYFVNKEDEEKISAILAQTKFESQQKSNSNPLTESILEDYDNKKETSDTLFNKNSN